MKQFSFLFILVFLGHFSLANAKLAVPSPIQEIGFETFWETGTLLSPYGEVVPLGHFGVEPYAFFFVNSDIYDDHWHLKSIPNFYTFNMQYDIFAGIAPKVDITLIPQFSYQSTQGQSTTVFNDLLFNFDVQIIERNDKSLIPTVKFIIGEIFPTGKYQHLNPKKLKTDIGGGGSYQTFTGFTITKLFHLTGHHFIKVFFTPLYIYFAQVHVKGFNSYGGGFGTNGKILARNAYETFLSFEYSLTHRWVLALDTVAYYEDRIRFKGRKGIDCAGRIATLGKPPSAHFSLAPAIEYLFRANMGIIAGSWFTIAGKNVSQFTSAVIAFVYYQ